SPQARRTLEQRRAQWVAHPSKQNRSAARRGETIKNNEFSSCSSCLCAFVVAVQSRLPLEMIMPLLACDHKALDACLEVLPFLADLVRLVPVNGQIVLE